MIVINRKNFLKNLACIIILILIIGIVVFLNKNNSITQTIALQVTDNINYKSRDKFEDNLKNRIIIIDPGHGLPDGGAVGKDGISEEEINLKISMYLKDLLEKSNYEVILTRSDRNGIYDMDSKTIREKKVSDLKNRAEIGNNSNAEIFISIHLNKIPQEKYFGYQTFYQKDDESSRRLAFFIQDNLNFAIQKNNKREILPLSKKYIMDNVKIPTVIVECGFLSNIKEAKLLESEEYQLKLAWGIYLGIIDYFADNENDLNIK